MGSPLKVALLVAFVALPGLLLATPAAISHAGPDVRVETGRAVFLMDSTSASAGSSLMQAGTDGTDAQRGTAVSFLPESVLAPGIDFHLDPDLSPDDGGLPSSDTADDESWSGRTPWLRAATPVSNLPTGCACRSP